jgi:alpha-glucuronidase
MLDHWDNLDGSVERGYAGRSLWNWGELPDAIDPRLRDYARANASIGINGSLINNVNANAQILSPDYLRKVAAIAGCFPALWARIFLSARFSAPMELGGLKTADPLDLEVAGWWKKKADEIYRTIPDFGGFVVKANSEGQPGPRTYNRSHVDGANMLAAALAPHNGVVIWRAYVYDMEPGYDRAGAAYENLHPFDGKFAANVLLQVKNGPIDFQPREPFHPLFGGMPQTQLMPELQITQEYMGQPRHTVFLVPMWKEALDLTFRKGRVDRNQGDRWKFVRPAFDGNCRSREYRLGSKLDGHQFLQANWYAFGRLAGILIWLRSNCRRVDKMTFTRSRDNRSDYSHHARIARGLGRLHDTARAAPYHGAASLWTSALVGYLERADWNPVYTIRPTTGPGIRSHGNRQQHLEPVSSARPRSVCQPGDLPGRVLLWFHHLPWDYRTRSGRILWDDLALHYQRGVDWTRATRKEWDTLVSAIDPERHAEVAKKLALQERDAGWWRDACLIYFQTFSKRPLPAGVEKPVKTLEEYKAKSLTW